MQRCLHAFHPSPLINAIHPSIRLSFSRFFLFPSRPAHIHPSSITASNPFVRSSSIINNGIIMCFCIQLLFACLFAFYHARAPPSSIRFPVFPFFLPTFSHFGSNTKFFHPNQAAVCQPHLLIRFFAIMRSGHWMDSECNRHGMREERESP